MVIPNARLRELRQETGVTVGPFARLVECSVSHLVNCENGNRDPSPELAARIAREASKLLGRQVKVTDFTPRSGTTPDRPPPQPARKPQAPPKRQDTETVTGPKRPDGALKQAS